MVDALNPAITSSAQWFERTLDDSANKRISVPEAFLATDAILSLYINVISGLTVYPNIIKKHLDEELPFMATENILMYCVKKGGDRQALHELIRQLSVETAKEMKTTGCSNNLIEKIEKTPGFGLTKEELNDIIRPEQFTGRSKEQTEEYLRDYVKPLLNKYEDLLGVDVTISV